LPFWLNTTGTPGEIADGQEDPIGQQIDEMLDPDSSTSTYHGLPAGSFQTFIQTC
jgi:hypothetical protein